MALDSKKVKQPVKAVTGVSAIMDFINSHPNPMVKKNSQEIMQVASELDDNSRNKTTLSDVRKAVKLFTKGQEVDSKFAGGLAGRLATRGYGKARR
tara:strand:- start:144 stop:431 length:288 start_codon:yes stop_codon:yes gene_type:complete